MSKYRARSCPNCNYYLGFSVATPLDRTTEGSVASFCLNCNYKLPIHTIVRGIRRAAAPLRRGALRLADIGRRDENTGNLEPQHLRAGNANPSISPADYARHLRAIGQDLENLRLSTFNIECAEDSYLVWSRASDAEMERTFHSPLSKNRWQKLWANRSQPRSRGREEVVMVRPHRQAKRYRYSLRDIDRMDREALERRRPRSAMADGHSFSQSLRTIGALVGQRGERLLGISWQNLSVSIVVETAKGRREIDVYRPDNLYDRWVTMYLRRENRALSDAPR